MVNSTQIELLDKLHVYVNAGYPSIHVYTVNEGLINYLRVMYHARIVQHKGTTDVVVSKRKDMLALAKFVHAHGSRQNRILSATLIRYCTARTPEVRQRLALMLKKKGKKA